MHSIKHLLFFLSLTFFACGNIKPGSGALNEPAPQGTIVFRGTFQSQNSKSISGTVLIYQQTDASYVVRLEGFNVTSTENTLKLWVRSNSSPVYSSVLRAYSGNMNYGTGLVGPIVWSTASIESITNVVQGQYGTATLIP